MFLLPSNDIYFQYHEFKNKKQLFKVNYLDDKFTAYLINKYSVMFYIQIVMKST